MKIYQVISTYTSGNTNGQSDYRHNQTLFETQDLNQANRYAKLVKERYDLLSDLNYSYKEKEQEAISKKIVEIVVELLKINPIDIKNLPLFRSPSDPKYLLFSHDGYFEQLVKLEVCEKPSDEQTFFKWEY